MKVLIPLCEENRVCNQFQDANMFAFVHFDVQAKRVFNWSLVCAPGGGMNSFKNWVVRRKPDLVVAAEIDQEIRNFLHSYGIELIPCKPGSLVGTMIDKILVGEWMPEVFDHRHMKSNAEILHS